MPLIWTIEPIIKTIKYGTHIIQYACQEGIRIYSPLPERVSPRTRRAEDTYMINTHKH